jgi:hypothetical protein
MKNKSFKFKWKLTENYFNAIMVFSFTILVAHAIVYNDLFFMALAAVLGIIFPLIATLIDIKSHEKPVMKKRK